MRMFLCWLCLSFTLSCSALEWNATEVAITTAPFQATQDVAIGFKNNGPRPVTILDLQTNCDCLDANADRKTYAPGETGIIKARFTIGDRSGLYERVISVVTDESPAPMRLMIKIDVPEIFAVAPRSLTWRLNAPAAEQTIELAPAPGLEITFTEAQPTNGAFKARIETLEPGRRYRIHVAPTTTGAPASAAIRVFGREKTGHAVVASAYASVE